jgi:hypothetical protein
VLPSCQTICRGDSWQLEGLFFPTFSPWTNGPSITSGGSEVVSLGDWPVSSMWFFLSTGQVAIETWGNTASLYKMVRFVVFSRQQLSCTTTLTLCGHLLPRQGGVVHLWIPSSVPWHQLKTPPQPHIGRLACYPNPALSLCALPPLCSLLVTLSVLLVFPLFRVWFLASSPFSEAGSAFHPTLYCHC